MHPYKPSLSLPWSSRISDIYPSLATAISEKGNSSDFRQEKMLASRQEFAYSCELFVVFLRTVYFLPPCKALFSPLDLNHLCGKSDLRCNKALARSTDGDSRDEAALRTPAYANVGLDRRDTVQHPRIPTLRQQRTKDNAAVG